jgi:hypothetical protein
MLSRKWTFLLNMICNDLPLFKPIPVYVKRGTKQILLTLQNRSYPTQGRNLKAYIVASVGIARGDQNAKDLHDLTERVNYIFHQKIPQGQIENTFRELRTFWKQRRKYPWHPKTKLPYLTKDERRLLSSLKKGKGIVKKANSTAS